MDIGTQRSIDKWFGVPLCALFSLLALLRPKRAVREPRAILVILLSEMGSMVCAQPMLRRLRQRHPEARLYALVFQKNRGVVDLLGLVPPDQVVCVDDRSFGALARSALAAIRTLRAAGVDAILDCELFSRVSAIFGFLIGAPVLVGFHRHTQEGLYRGSFITRPVLYNPYAHISTQFLGLAAALDSESSPLGKESPLPERPALVPVELPAAEVDAMAARLHADFPALRGKRLVLVYPGSGLLPIRGWPLEHYERLCAALADQGYVIAVIGLASDRPLGRRIVAHVGAERCADLTGYTANLREVVALCLQAALLVSNDGGPGHFASLTAVPVLSFFGPETPLLYGPLAPRAVNLFRGLPCSPCLSAYNHRATPCDGDNQCLKQVGVEEALAAARRLLAGDAAA
jgi:ADP-heptose:LPS heptosyltransferase